jgi:hypothetical protein
VKELFPIMTKSKPTRPSRQEDEDTQRRKRAARLLRVDMLPDGAAMVTQAGDARDESETEAAMRRAVDKRNRKAS